MRTFTKKPKVTQQTKSAKSPKPSRSFVGQSRDVHSILHLQRTIGNQAVLRLLQTATDNVDASSESSVSTRFAYDFSGIPVRAYAHSNIQPKLKVNAPEDRYEQEADRVADEVLQQNTPEKRNEKKSIQARPLQPALGGEHEVHAELENHLNRSKGGGSPISDQVRAFFEPRMQFDFSRVRIHTDSEADRMNRDLSARAFTHGSDIFFGAGQYDFNSLAGKRLIVHELTHVAQQTFRAPSSREGVFREEAAGQPDASEMSQRRTIMDDMTSGMAISDALRDQIVDAMRAFSINQLETMQRHGVLMWGPSGVPPRFTLPDELVSQLAPLNSPAAYYPTLRLIRVRDDLTVSPLRHELGHAWDYTRGLHGRGQRPIYQLPPAEQERRVRVEAASGRSSERSWSGGRQDHIVRVGGSEERLTIETMYERYNTRVEASGRGNEVAFDSGARRGHSRRSVQEFYAEGYNTFHGTDEIAQARLLNYAPELFSLLQSEAASEGLSTPDEVRLRTLIQHHCHIPTMRADPVCP